MGVGGKQQAGVGKDQLRASRGEADLEENDASIHGPNQKPTSTRVRAAAKHDVDVGKAVTTRELLCGIRGQWRLSVNHNAHHNNHNRNHAHANAHARTRTRTHIENMHT